MKETIWVVVLLLGTCVSLQAQRITRTYNHVSLSEALRQLSEQTDEYTISFLYNELEDFRITTSVRRKSVPDAIRQMIGFYPIRMTVEDKEIVVECTHKTDCHLTGIIVDEKNLPVVYANIAVLNPADSTILSGGVSNESGYFAIPYETPPPVGGGREGAVLARISYVGYKTVYHLCPQPEVGTIRLQPETFTIKGVVVKGEIPQYQMTAGGMTVNVQGTLLSRMGTATDVLGQLPRVSVSPEGSVTVYGKGTPLVYINNRQVRDDKELTRLKSEDIKAVEIISAPGARYDATAESIIRIRTIKRLGEGFSVNTESNLSNNAHWRGYEDLTVKYSTDRLQLSANGFYMHSHRTEDNDFGQSLYGLSEPVEIRQYLLMHMRYDNLYGEATLNYDVNDSTSFGLTYDVYSYFNDKAWGEGPEEIWKNGQLTGTMTMRQDVSEDTGPNHTLNAYLTSKLGRLAVDFNGTCVWRHEERGDLTRERSTVLGDRDVHTDMTQRNRMQAAKLVLSYSVLKGELSLGTETTHTQTQGSYTNAEGYASNSETNIRESNTAYFTEYHRPVGPVELRAGLRYEHVNSRYYLFGLLQDDLSRRYDQWFPNAALSWNKGKWGLQMSYNRRTQRPSYWALRNFLQYDNRYSFEGGNPQLRPQIKHSLQLDAKYAWLSLQAAYTYQKDAIVWASILNREQSVSVLSNRNFPHCQSLYLSLSASPKLGFWQPTWDASLRQNFFDIGQYPTQFAHYKPDLTLNLRNAFAISKTTMATLSCYWHTWEYEGFIASKPMLNLSASLSQSFFHEALTVRLYASDLLKTYRERWTMYGLGVNLYKDCYNNTRQVGLTVTYNFNPSRSKYKGTGAGNDEKNRL